VLDHQPTRPLCLVSCRSGSAACFCCMPTRARLTTRTKPAIAHLPRTTVARDVPLSSAAKLRAPPRLPHSTFSSSDVTRRKPPARAASRSTEDHEFRSALLAPAVDREGHPAPQSRPERPRSREQEPRLPHTATETSPSHPKSMTKLRFLALFLLLFLCYACVILALFLRYSCVILALSRCYSGFILLVIPTAPPPSGVDEPHTGLVAVAEHARTAARTGRRPQGPAASQRTSGTALRCRLVSFRTPPADRKACEASCTSPGGPPGAPEPARAQGGRRRRPPASGPSAFNEVTELWKVAE